MSERQREGESTHMITKGVYTGAHSFAGSLCVLFIHHVHVVLTRSHGIIYNLLLANANDRSHNVLAHSLRSCNF